jgi:hypothetical protein
MPKTSVFYSHKPWLQGMPKTGYFIATNHGYIYYIVESEIQWHIFHIFTSEDIDHVTFSIYTIFYLGLYNKQNITPCNLHVGLKILLLSSRVKNNILLVFTHWLSSFVKYCFHHSKIKSHIFAPPCNILYICLCIYSQVPIVLFALFRHMSCYI